jgi:hypothetical protein
LSRSQVRAISPAGLIGDEPAPAGVMPGLVGSAAAKPHWLEWILPKTSVIDAPSMRMRVGSRIDRMASTDAPSLASTSCSAWAGTGRHGGDAGDGQNSAHRPSAPRHKDWVGIGPGGYQLPTLATSLKLFRCMRAPA